MSEPVRDRPEKWDVVSTERPFTGHVFAVRRDAVRMPGADGMETVDRDVLEHPGSVAIVAVDDRDRVLLVRQYRHPVGHMLWEVPAGLRDVDGEPLQALAARELLEEAGQRAARWDVLVDAFTSPGMSGERVRIFLARETAAVPADQIDFVAVHEEAGMPVEWVPLEEAVRKVLAGEIHNLIAVAGILAAHTARAGGYAGLRPVESPEG